MDGRRAENHCTIICKISLRIIGIWPDQKGFLTRCRVTAILILIFFFIIVPQTTKLVLIWGNIDEMSEILCKVNLPSVIIIFMIFVIERNKADLKSLVALISEDWNNQKSEEERMIMLNMAQAARKISLICLLLSQGTIQFHTGGEIYYNIMIDHSNDSVNQTRRLFILSHFPYNTKHSPIFELTWFTQFLATFLATVTYAGVHGFFGILVIHLCGQYTTLRFRLLNTVNQIVAGTCKKEFQEEFRNIVKRHQKLNRFVDIIENSFNVLLLIEILLSCLEFCLQAYQLSIYVRKTGEDFTIIPLLLMVIFITYMLVVFYVYCHVGELLQYHSMKIGFAAYKSKWHELPSKEAKQLAFLMQRSAKPGIITAGKFFVLSLELFSKVLKTSLGYLSVLMTL